MAMQRPLCEIVNLHYRILTNGFVFPPLAPGLVSHTWQLAVTWPLLWFAKVFGKEAERDMNYVSQVCEVGMMRFTLREDSEPEYLGRAAEEILQLPSVLRVRTNPARQEIEITFKQPAEGLLRRVNNALRLVGTEMTASKVR